jgi:hypothetical protein
LFDDDAFDEAQMMLQ